MDVSDLHSLIGSGLRFGTIYADPPWRYRNRASRGAAENHYQTMSQAELLALPVAELAAPCSHLHLWTTTSFLSDALEVLKAWGFDYEGELMWVKPQLGLGNYWRVGTEFLLLGVRGGLPFSGEPRRSWFKEPRTRHSKKPESVRRLLEEVSPAPRLELFARRESPGWHRETAKSRGNGGLRPGDDFNARTTWPEILEPHGWRRVFERGGETYWRRPGKPAGISATTGYSGSDLLYVFSTSTLFESERGYDKFGAYAVLEHGGDLEAAARTLRAKGFGAAKRAELGDGPAGKAAERLRPEVLLSGRQLDAIVEDAVRVLLAANDPPELFQRAGLPSRIRRDEHGAPIIAPVGEAGLVEALSRAARWVRMSEKGKQLNAQPTRALAGVLLEALHRREGTLPPLRGIVEAPFLRADGTIVDVKGYDPASGLYYAPPSGFQLPHVPEHPTEPELRAAVSLLGEMLEEFPFRGDADLATGWGLILTPPLRTLIAGPAPLILIDAPAPGTGKTLLVRAGSIVATGHGPSLMSPPGDRDDSEARKRITSALLLGVPLVVIDNVERPIASAALAAVLTSERWTDRLLGRSELVTLPAHAVWVATGNNLRLRGDLPRRSVWCRLDAKLAQPWTREKFKRPDLIGWVRECRGEHLAAAFTLARAWIDAGSPAPDIEAEDWPRVPRMGGFEAWRHVIGGVLMVAGIPGFLANLPQLYDQADEDTPAWTGFLEAWAHAVDGPVTAADLARAIGSGGKLFEALPGELAEALEDEKKARGFTRRLGRALARKEDTRFVIRDRTLRIARCGEEQRAVRWIVRSEVS